MNYSRAHCILFLIIVGMHVCSAEVPVKSETRVLSDSVPIVQWNLAEVVQHLPQGWSLIGNPQIIDSPFGKAVQFQGQSDGIEIDTNYLIGLHQFTIEIIFCPDTNGMEEQRFIHMGEVRGERVMIETRLTRTNEWYLDTYMKYGQVGLTLKDSTRLHPLRQWYHIAFVVDGGTMEAFVNGQLELHGQIPFSSFTLGKTSLGVRLNRVNWFKGAVYSVKITPRKLHSNAFMKLDK